MADDRIELTRRKILGSLGAVGAAGAAAGFGTTALFSDEEEFANNTITAGRLDLKMDWEEHYSFPQIYDGFTDPTVEDGTELDVVRSDPEDSRYVGLPDPENPVVWANAEDDPLGNGKSSLELYFQNTTIEAFPDRAGGEVEATFTTLDSGDNPIVENPCDALADVPGDLGTYSEDVDTPARTKNGDTYDSENDQPNPLLNLEDVKPGDFGEFTFSAHLCGNPGHLWLQMPGGLAESENDLEGPEQSVDETPNEGELAENVQTALWYDDDCNNRIDGEPEDLVALAIVDTSGSTSSILQEIRVAANTLVEKLYNASQQSNVEIQAGIIAFNGDGDANDVVLQREIQPISSYVDGSGNGEFDSTDLPNTNGNSPIPQALDVGREYLNDKVADLSLSDPNKEILVVSDGAATYETTGSAAFGELLDDSGNVFSFNGNSYTSDLFDGSPNADFVTIPNPNVSSEGGTARAETALVARDVDGEPFLQNTQYSQPAGPKVDNPDGQSGDPADISGDNGITVRAAAVYSPNASQSDIDLARDTMMAYATSAGTYYDLPASGPQGVANSLAADLNVLTGESVIFRGTLQELADELDPTANGPQKLVGDQPNGCYAPGATHCFGLAWWVPEDVGNEIQGDSVSFDLGFYAEQCRNNDNPGQTL
jgi:predicted ribosomally synthesized peptide with SipW-like signal peptide